MWVEMTNNDLDSAVVPVPSSIDYDCRSSLVGDCVASIVGLRAVFVPEGGMSVDSVALPVQLRVVVVV